MELLDAAIRSARRTPTAPAIIAADTTLSWAEYIDSAGRIATFLERHGVQPGHLLGFSSEFPAIMQTVLAAAGWYRAAASCIVTGRVLDAMAPELDGFVTPDPTVAARVPHAILLDNSAMMTLGTVPPAAKTESFPSEEALCRLIFSSGTTGTPKAVPFTVSQLLHRVSLARAQWMPERPFMSILGISAASGFLTFVESLRSGDPYLVPGAWGPTLRLLRDQRVRALKASPAQLARINAGLASSGLILPDLQVIESAGSVLPDRLHEELIHRTGAKVVNLYGSCEAGTVAIGAPGGEDGLVGEVLDGVEVQIVDESGQPVLEGEEGSIRVRRPGLPEGYFGDPEASRQAFVDGWFSSGDQGSLRGGRLYVRGRVSEVINAAGVKVLPGEVEQSLLSLPGISDVAVLRETDELGVDHIVARYVGNATVNEPAWLARAGALLGDAMPYRFDAVAEIPRNENGKILRDVLIARAVSPKEE